MTLHDWNGNGKTDMTDAYMEYHIYEGSARGKQSGSPNPGRTGGDSRGGGWVVVAVILLLLFFFWA